MNVFRNLNIQRLFSTIVLFIALFSQIQTLYACDSMDGKPEMLCCCGEHDSAICPMTDHCGRHEPVETSPCCELSYDVLNEASMVNSVTTVDTLTLLLDSAQPPPIIGNQQFSVSSLPIVSQLVLAAAEPPVFNLKTPTYLLTRRLRL